MAKELLSPSLYPDQLEPQPWLVTMSSTGRTGSKITVLEAGLLIMRKPTISAMAVPNLPSAAPLVGQVVLEWLPMRFVLLHADCLAKMSQYTKGVERDREAGGILLGSYRGPHIEISAITEPLPTDVRARYRFDRSDPGHQVAAMSAWQSSAGTTTFAGEWHTHPEMLANPFFSGSRDVEKIDSQVQQPPRLCYSGLVE